MLIIVEGCDGSGKSTLVDHISETFSFEKYKESLSYQDRLKVDYSGFDHYIQLIDILSKSSNNVICDRLHIGESVNPIIRKDGRNPLTVSEIEEVEHPIRKSALLILCLPSIEFTKNVFETRGEDVAKIEDIKYLHYLYNLFGNSVSTIKNKYIFNVENDSSYKKIDAFIKELNESKNSGK